MICLEAALLSGQKGRVGASDDLMGGVVRSAILVVACLAGLAATSSGRAAEPLYESKLIRLAEVLGSIHSLRNLCGERSNEWRDQMDAVILAENPDPTRKARLIASFNRGYRSFSESYSTCTESALAAIDLYMKEGDRLSSEIITGYGN